jgi:ABC-2 type transport system ATP-binding protein
MEPVLDIKNLGKNYEGFRLQDVSFSIPQGYIMGLIGPNGAGKTTIIKLILNLVKKSGGEIRVFGQDHITEEVAIKSRIGFVHDAPLFYDYLGLEQIKKIVARFYREWDDAVFHRLAGEFELPLGKKFRELSRGTRMKFALALALSHHADFIIMDEPTSGLDPVFRRELLDKLADLLQDEKKSILFSTHITSDLERIADYITFINQGKIVFSTSKDEILEKWGVVKGGRELLDGLNRALFRGIKEHDFGFEALTADADQARRTLEGKAVIERASLEDIMFHIVKGDNHA